MYRFCSLLFLASLVCSSWSCSVEPCTCTTKWIESNTTAVHTVNCTAKDQVQDITDLKFNCQSSACCVYSTLYSLSPDVCDVHATKVTSDSSGKLTCKKAGNHTCSIRSVSISQSGICPASCKKTSAGALNAWMSPWPPLLCTACLMALDMIGMRVQ